MARTPEGNRRFAVGAATVWLLLLVPLAASCGSSPPTSAGLPVPISCGNATACLTTARADGFRGDVLTPTGSAFRSGGSYYIPPLGNLGWGFQLAYHDLTMKQAFEEQIGTKPIVTPCLVQSPGTQLETSATGLSVCLNVEGREEAAHLYTDGVLYQLDFTGRTTLTTDQQKAYLVWLADQLR